MKVKKLGLEWGAAFEEATPVQITHGEAEIIVYVTEGGDLCVQTVRADWQLSSHNGGSDCKLIITS